MAEEISNQTLDLPRFASQLRQKQGPKLGRSPLVFAGSGDSYAAAVFAQELSQGEAIALDPYELLRNTRRIRGKNLVIISVSGKTKTNLELAREAKGIAANILAITANPQSPLARECDETLQLKYRTTGILTCGTVSFTTSLLACASLLRNLPRTIQLKTVLDPAAHLATELKQPSEGTFLFTGSGVTKMFTIEKKRDVIGCISSGRDKAMKMHEMLRKNDFRSLVLTVSKSNIINRSLQIAVHLQQLVFSLAKKREIRECAFLSDRKRLDLSNKVIY